MRPVLRGVIEIEGIGTIEMGEIDLEWPINVNQRDINQRESKPIELQYQGH